MLHIYWLFLLDHKEEQLNEKELEEKRVVYEALIEDKGKNVVYLRLSSATVQALNLKVIIIFL